MEPVRSDIAPTELRKHLFYETSHSPSLADLVGYEEAKDIIDFCFIAKPYYPTPAVLHVNPDNLIIGNGATELIVLMNTTLIDRIAIPIPTFGEYIEKLKDQRDAELFALRPEENYK